MSHQGTSFASEKNVLQDVLKREIEQVGRFSPESTAEDVAKILASDITGKIGTWPLIKVLKKEYT